MPNRKGNLLGRLEHYTPPVGLASGYYLEYDYNNLGEKTRLRITDGTTTSATNTSPTAG